jgi:hypothetical protein
LVQFLKYHTSNPLIIIDGAIGLGGKRAFGFAPSDISEAVGDWYASFINDLDNDELQRLFRCAESLSINPLLHLIGFKLASLVNGKTTEEIRRDMSVTRGVHGEALLGAGRRHEAPSRETEKKWEEEDAWCMDDQS